MKKEYKTSTTLKRGQEYTFSVETSLPNAEVDVYIGLDYFIGRTVGQKITFEISRVVMSRDLIVDTGSGGDIIERVKLEKGSKATDWTPAPEDDREYVESQIRIASDEVSSTISNDTDTKISSVTQRVDLFEIAVDDKVSELGTRVTATEKGLSSKVSSTDFNGNTIASLITQTPSAISLVSRNIDLTGRVTFSSFSDATTNKIDGIESEAGTAKARADSAYSRASTALTSAGTASSTATTALDRANSAKGTTDEWRYRGTTEIDGGRIRTSTIETDDLRANGTLWGHELYGGSISLGNSKTEFTVNADGDLKASGGGFKVPATADGVYNRYKATDTGRYASRWKVDDSNYFYQDNSQARFYIDGDSRFRFSKYENRHWGIRISDDASIVALSSTGQVNFRNANNTGYIAIGATDFKVGSNKSLKQNIKPAKTSLKTVADTPVYNFEFKRGFINTMKNTDKNTKTGFIVEESPLEILGDDNSVSITNSIGVLWKAVQELNEEVNRLKGESIDE